MVNINKNQLTTKEKNRNKFAYFCAVLHNYKYRFFLWNGIHGVPARTPTIQPTSRKTTKCQGQGQKKPQNRHGFAAFEFPVLIILSIQSLKQPEICCLNPGEFFLLPFLSCSMVHYRKSWAGAVMLWMGCR